MVIYFKDTIISTSGQILTQAKLLVDTNLKEAFTLAEKALLTAIQEDNAQMQADIRLFLSSLYLKIYNFEKIMEHTSEALPYYLKQNDYRKVANCYHFFGWVYYFLEDNEKRLESNLKCLKYRRKAGDEAGEVSTLNNIGDTYIQLKNYDKALYYFNLCLKMPKLDKHTQTIVVHNIGETYFFAQEYAKAIPYLKQGLKLAIQSKYDTIYISGNIYLAKIYLQTGKLSLTEKHIHEAFNLARKDNHKESLIDIYGLFSEYFALTGDTEKAYRYLKQHIELKETVFKENNIKRIQRLQLGFEVDSLKHEAQKQKEINKELKKAFWQIEQQNRQIEHFNKEIKASIRYAKRIQEVLVQPHKQFLNYVKEYTYFYLPKDIVSGDFYWSFCNGTDIYFALADCTGHGVPGAFMSILGISSLNEIISENTNFSPAEILNKLQQKILDYLTKSSQNRDGMDIFLIKYSPETCKLQYAGANNSMYIVSEKEFLHREEYKKLTRSNPFLLYEIRGDKQPIGFYEYFTPFSDFELSLTGNETLYFFTDGYADQFGGPKGKKMMVSRLKEFILRNARIPLQEQKEALAENFFNWKGNLEQVDDVSFFAIRF